MKQVNEILAKAVIFDMDGVLIDSEPYYTSRFENLFRAYSKPFTAEALSRLAGASSQMEFEIVRSFWGEDISTDELKKMYREVNSQNRPDYNKLVFPDAITVLDRIRDAGFIMALASSSGIRTIERVLDSLGIQNYFSSIVSGEMFEQSKPHPEIYLHSMESLGLQAQDCIAIEDSTYGVRSASAAGLRVVAIRDHRFGYDQSDASWLIESLSELPALLGI
ncbi:MAG: HAD family phosphatase [Clostridiaceae bacterium]|nr:HAD family phosphatase [Clostridiaceae bacterium]